MSGSAAKVSFQNYAESAPENYERYFVPVIGRPFAAELVEQADVRPGERVLDIACGTGIAARIAAERVGPGGSVTGIDVNPGMLGVARAAAASEPSIDWREAPAERLPFPDSSFDVVLCSLGLQFFRDRRAALGEAHRVLGPDDRIAVSLVGPTPPPFALLEDAMSRHVSRDAAEFVDQVFALHDPDEIRELLGGAGFGDVTVDTSPLRLTLPAPVDFLWQYVLATPLAAAVKDVDKEALGAFEREVAAGWERFVQDGRMVLQPQMIIAVGRRA